MSKLSRPALSVLIPFLGQMVSVCVKVGLSLLVFLLVLRQGPAVYIAQAGVELTGIICFPQHARLSCWFSCSHSCSSPSLLPSLAIYPPPLLHRPSQPVLSSCPELAMGKDPQHIGSLNTYFIAVNSFGIWQEVTW